MNRYAYEGPVVEFDRCVQNHWQAETTAVSEKKAKSNLMYRWKQNNNRGAATKVALPGKLYLIG